MRKQNAVIILKFDYRYITKVCIHALFFLKNFHLFECKQNNKTYKIVLLLSRKTSFVLLVHVELGLKLYLKCTVYTLELFERSCWENWGIHVTSKKSNFQVQWPISRWSKLLVKGK